MNLDFLKGLLGAGAANGGRGSAGQPPGAGTLTPPGPGYFSGQPFAPTPGPGQPGAPPGPNLGGSGGGPFDFLGRINNSINPISLLRGLMGGAPPNQFRPIWKPTNTPQPSAAPQQDYSGDGQY